MNHLDVRLRLEYPPITNREADYIREERPVQAILKKATLYALARRPETTFTTLLAPENDDKLIRFQVGTPGVETSSEGIIDLNEIPALRAWQDWEVEIGNVAPERPPWGIRLWGLKGRRRKFICSITPFRALFDRSRGQAWISGLDDYEKFLTFDLHYFGKSKDALRRLLTAGHEKRQELLSRMHSQASGAAVTDELAILMFTARHVHQTTLYPVEPGIPAPPPDDLVTSDAEKALIHFLRPPLNKELYEAYPKGADSLYNYGLKTYRYALENHITLKTSQATFLGAGGSAINVTGDSADLVR